jgi:hypothetical protein
MLLDPRLSVPALLEFPTRSEEKGRAAQLRKARRGNGPADATTRQWQRQCCSNSQTRAMATRHEQSADSLSLSPSVTQRQRIRSPAQTPSFVPASSDCSHRLLCRPLCCSSRPARLICLPLRLRNLSVCATAPAVCCGSLSPSPRAQATHRQAEEVFK